MASVRNESDSSALFADAAWIRENAPPATVSLTARIAEDRRAYEIVEDTGEIAGSLAADVARDCGHGFLLEPPDRAAGL